MLAKIASHSGIFFGGCLLNAPKSIAHLVEQAAHGIFGGQIGFVTVHAFFDLVFLIIWYACIWQAFVEICYGDVCYYSSTGYTDGARF